MVSKKQTCVLVIDDEGAMREVLSVRLVSWGFEVECAANASDGLARIQDSNPDIVICDVVMPDGTGLDVIRRVSETGRTLPFIMMTAHGAVDIAVEAMKQGAFDFLTKPLDYPKLLAVLEAARDEVRAHHQMNRLGEAVKGGEGLGAFVGASAPMKKVYELIRKLSLNNASVLVTGESGTGKELAARTIHQLSDRSEEPFVAVNAAAIPSDLIESEIFGHERGAFTGAGEARPGCFEQADGGTLLLDEIAEMPLALQPKLLRVLEDGKVRRLGGRHEKTCDVRVITATNQNPTRAVEERKLRQDLLYRINVFTVEMPPLRRRPGDIRLLAFHFLELFRKKHGLDVRGIREEVLGVLDDYSWPGNVRELRNIMERGVVLAGRHWIELTDLPPYLSAESEAVAGELLELPDGITAAEAERRLILHTLQRVDNNKAEAARQLGVDVKTIRNKLKGYEAG